MENCKKEHRLILPVPMFHTDYNIWAVLKNCIGKELSKITMPVVFNEPLSFLQRMAEYMEYAHLLKVASQQEDPLKRLQYVIGFAVSALASNWERLGKPFNPLLGETYELEREDFRIVCEQVSHHPPVSAFHAEGGDDWVFHGSIHPKLKFWGKSVEIQPKGTITVEFPKLKEAYTWTNVTCCVHNIIMGKMWMEQCGNMEIISHGSTYKANLTFKQAGGSSKNLHRVEGYISDKSKQKLFHIYGKWTEYIKCVDYNSYEEYTKEQKLKNDQRSKSPNESPSHTSKKMLQKFNSLKVATFKSQNSTQEADDCDPEELPKGDANINIEIANSTTLWQVAPRPPQSGDYYQFTEFAMSLNEIEQGMEKVICPTDSRLRPDIRKLEQGDIDGAAIEKTRLEEKQRDANKSRKSKNATQWSPRWFKQGINPYTQQEDWISNGNYWKRQYPEDLDIF
ncbi:oxysterol-binding protein-related protein 2 [Anthonomus grandis grandis]|uniref:oxysterol-binding protein-related protein 2 n=1 Tax=Anthonomus grandis grandis TaxID=2921223 RepID=UPI0021669496|nr:oxysterol-binding protein-related protein 2 [Anthonomus grandis grandis]XP_050314791.1 oxysterol-binding protein-related protein 2 [Anthonomus grandis grandis]XP_050314792.1 oxysterol-binding protein-related protein 2 [Anthonomus grandis grandis]